MHDDPAMENFHFIHNAQEELDDKKVEEGEEEQEVEEELEDEELEEKEVEEEQPVANDWAKIGGWQRYDPIYRTPPYLEGGCSLTWVHMLM